MSQETITVKLVKSPIGHLRTHRKILTSLGLRKLNQEKVLPDCPSVRGQVKKVEYLVTIVDR
jgi:large subunit ribosomal protein L30